MTKLSFAACLSLLVVATGCGGSDSGPSNPPTIASFTASSASVPYGGSDVTLAWVQTDASNLTITPIGNVGGTTSVVAHLTETTTFTLTASNAKGSVTAQVTVTVRDPTAAPTLTGFTANPSTLPIVGGQVTLLWNANEAQSLFIDHGVGTVTGKSQITTTITATTTFTLSASNPLGSATAQTTVTVYVPTAPPTITAFTATPANLPLEGGQTTLSWSAVDAQTLSIDGIGDVTNKTSQVVNLTATTTYTLRASNIRGTSTAQTTVVVYVPANKPAISGFSASPPNLPLFGGQTTLSWNVTDAASVSIDNGVGNVSGKTSQVVNVTQTTTFTLSATNVRGTSSATTTVTVYVPTAAPAIISFLASPSTLPAGGGSTLLSWTTNDATELELDNGIGNVLGTTSRFVTVTSTTAFKLTARNVKGSSQFIVLVTVNNPTSAPTIGSFTANPQSVPAGGGWVTLNWNVNGATTLALDNNLGVVTGSSSKSAWVATTTTFTLTASNSAGSSFASNTVAVASGGGSGGSGSRTITGKVVYDGGGGALAFANVDVLGHGSTTADSSGNFTLTNVPDTYDIAVSDTASNVTLYKGVTRSNPTLVVTGVNPPKHTSGDIWGSLTSDVGAGPGTDALVIFGGSGAGSNGVAANSFSDYDFLSGIDWYGTAATGNVYGFAGFGTASPRVGKSSALTLDSSTRSRDVTLTAATAYEVIGNCYTPSASYTLSFKQAGVSLSAFSGIYIQNTEAGSLFDLYTASVPGGEAYVSCSASNGAATTYARQGNITGDVWSATLSLPSAPNLSAPFDGASNIGVGSSFAWSAFSGGVHIVRLAPQAGFSGPTVSIVTSASSLTLPDLSQASVILPSDGSYTWTVSGYAPLSSTDDATNGSALASVLAGSGTFRSATSAPRSLSTTSSGAAGN